MTRLCLLQVRKGTDAKVYAKKGSYAKRRNDDSSDGAKPKPPPVFKKERPEEERERVPTNPAKKKEKRNSGSTLCRRDRGACYPSFRSSLQGNLYPLSVHCMYGVLPLLSLVDM